ncbi:hypothetical protein V2J09_005507 [Rumex salicifolius]
MFTSNRTLDSLGAGISSLLKPQTASHEHSSSSMTDLGPQLSKHNGTEILSCTSSATVSKEKSENTSKTSLLESSTKNNKHPPKCDQRSAMKHPVDQPKCNSSGLLVSVDKGGTHIPSCPSPSNSIFSATHYTEAKQSFTEVSDCASSVDKSRESCEVSNSCDFSESRKTSLYRASTGSDQSDESSASGYSSMVYKPHKANNDVRWEAIQAVRSRYGALELKHFRMLMELGCGDIGRVHLAELAGTGAYFAVKVMDKAKLEGRKKLLRAQTEREILQCLDHPFLPTLYSHFETEKAAFLVMEFCPGGDLHVLSQRQRGRYFSEQAARFYVAEILLALEYLHMLGIVYRDLKPENVLVREDGHIMLSDFDLSLRCTVSPTIIKSSHLTVSSKNSSSYCIEPACIIQPDCALPVCFSPGFLKSKKKKSRPSKTRPDVVTPLPELMAEPTAARSMSFVGTHEYLAPEIIKGEGHGSAVDWWTLGIFLYELLFGRTPFRGPENRATLFNVVGQPLRFPDSPVVSFAARDLIRGLLVKDPHHRLAYRRGATEIKQHPFFQSVNWALIRCATPPQVPPPFVAELSRRANCDDAGAGVKPKEIILAITLHNTTSGARRGLGGSGGGGLNAGPILALAVLAFWYALIDGRHVSPAASPSSLPALAAFGLVAHL